MHRRAISAHGVVVTLPPLFSCLRKAGYTEFEDEGVMIENWPTYPDISDILARKERGRERLASLSFGEKIKILEAMRERDEMFRRIREERDRKSEQSPGKR